MFGKLLLLSSLAANAVLAAPQPREATLCEQYGECEWVQIGTYSVQRLVNASSSALERRQDGVQTNIDVGEDNIRDVQVSFDQSEADAPEPQSLQNLWNRASEACLTTSCNPAQAITEGSYSLSATGQFRDQGERDNFITLLREAYQQTIAREAMTEVITIPGPGGLPGGNRLQVTKTATSTNFFNVNRFGGDASGQFLSVLITRTDTGGCGNIVNAILGGLSLAPTIGTFFGAIGAACTLSG